jgi:hypothetical protein
VSAAKTSRNRQRKTAYAAMANQSSRNQAALSGPVVGSFETVTHETRAKFGESGEALREYEVPVKPYQRIVHDAKAAPKENKAPKDSPRRKVYKRPNPENKNPVGRCKAKATTARGMARCDLRRGHDGDHAPRPFGVVRKNGH